MIQWGVNQGLDYLRMNWPERIVPSLLSPDPEDPFMEGFREEIGSDHFDLLLAGAKYAWKARRDEAASIGTIAHNWIEGYLKGEDPPWPEDIHARNSCEAALEWINSVHWESVKIEHQIYLPELGVGGICDWYARINGRLAVPDWKTSKSLHSSYAYQTAAYLKALEDEFGESIPDRWLIRIDKETGEVDPRYLPTETISSDYNAFESAVTIYRREAELKKEWLHTRNSM